MSDPPDLCQRDGNGSAADKLGPVARQRDKIAYCYESQLLAHPDLAGDVTVQFFIQPNGTVQSASPR